MKSQLFFKIIFSISFVFFTMPIFSQEKIDSYKTESDGYFVHPTVTSKGIVFSDNTASKIYLLQNDEMLVLVSAPGCGRYCSVSPDKSKIGFKLINPYGMQLPAVFDLQTMKIKELFNPADLCGQVSFSNNGKTAFTIGNDLYVTDNVNVKSFSLGVYSNITPISPNGDYVVFNKDDDQLYVLDLSSGIVKKITDDHYGYTFPQWSPDGSKLIYSSLPGELMVWEMSSGMTYEIGVGENATWSDDSQYLFFDIISSDNFEFNGSEIYAAKFDGSEITRLTNTSAVNEMCPVPLNGNSIMFSTYEKREIVTTDVSLNFSGIQLSDTLVKSTQPLDLAKGYSDSFTQKSGKAITMISGTAPYVHQMYDTPDWHSGGGSCAPTTAIMAIGYYNRLPYWDITCSWPSSHTSHYGAYVADKYRCNEIYYDTYADAYGTDAYGGYGYMWGNGSPNSYMASYISNHNIASVHSTSTTFQDVLDEIDNNYPFPICNLLSTAGHLTLTVGYVNGQHTLIFNDPYGDKNDGSWPNYYGENAYYDWPGYNNGYENLNTMAWTVTAESSEPAYNDTIIDDVYYNHGFYMHNQDPSHMRYFRDNATGGYNNHFWYTYTSASTTVDTCYVTWTPNLPSYGDYEVSVYIPTSNASATTARYNVYYNGGNQTVVVNQAPIYGEWVSLGTFPFLAGTSGYVRLGDGTGIASQKIAFDAMKWVKVSQPAAVAAFNASATSVCEGNSVQYTNTSSNAISYSWTFNGGTPATSTQTNPLVVYSNSGIYTVSLVATGPGGSNTLTMTNYITVNSPATAGFNASDTLVYLPSAFVTFTNSSSDASSYGWDFGDGTTSTAQNPNHTYNTTGDYTVTLVAYNSQCGNDTTTMIVHVLNPAPVAGFSATPTFICEGSSVQFTSTSTNTTSYNWSFTGGLPASSTLANPSVVYANAGTYTVELIVTGPGGTDTLNIQNYITVNPLTNAQFSVNDTLVFLPSANVIFTNASSNATSYLWDFGDGSTSTDQNPWHSYSAVGDYTIKLIAFNAQCGNDTLTMTDYIRVDVSTSNENENSDDIGIFISPNPTSGNFTISYELKEQNEVEIIMYDILGKEITVLSETLQRQGKHVITFGNEQLHLSDGIYLIKFSIGDLLFREKIIYQR